MLQLYKTTLLYLHHGPNNSICYGRPVIKFNCSRNKPRIYIEMDKLDSRCRICLVDDEEESLIATGVDFCEQIKCFTGIQLSEGPNWPKKICIGCALLIRAARKLRLLCQESEKEFRQEAKKYDVPSKCREENSIDSDTEMEPEYLDNYEASHGSPKSTTDSHCSVEISIKLDSPALSAPGELEPPSTFAPVEQESPSAIGPVKRKPPSAVSPMKRKPQSTAMLSLSPVGTPTPETESKSSKNKRFACHICPNTYKEKAKLTVHMLVHNKLKRHECEICHKRFNQTTPLKRHMNTHTGLRPYKCDFCDSSFADPSTRIKHQRIHTNERPYKCTFCSREFAYSNVLSAHLKTHTNEKPYKCQHCKRTFIQVHHKNAHEKSHRMKDMDTVTVIEVEEE
ncbi:zinc finger protein 75A [Drosophila obscura]|uniref:zinc finger protein 75A n=1 Tax=Drosophila obscura TaxID=7282 RepID=UPI001BB1E091|nr:zinc finger protein 75A [Drosophila obscura]